MNGPAGWKTEIEELHAFFEAYFLARLTVDDTERFTSVLDPDFTLVTPDGTVHDRADTIDMVTTGHGHTAELTVATSDHTLLFAESGIMVVSYVEHHALAGGITNARLSTAVMTEHADAPNGLRWRRVHETWRDG